jgi:hypothetical protein
VRLNRSSLIAVALGLLSAPILHAAQTGVFTCAGATPIKVSYFDIAPPTASTNIGSQSGGAGAGKVTFGTLTIHAALQQFGTLAPAMGSSFTSCTLTHNSLTFTFGLSVLTNLDAISGAASTGTAGTASYTQAVFSIASVSVSGGNDGDDGGDDGGWNRSTNTAGSAVPIS